jgi:hypothetical protein
MITNAWPDRILLLAACGLALLAALACARKIRERKQAGKTATMKPPEHPAPTEADILKHPRYHAERESKRAAINRLWQLLPVGFVEPATGALQHDYFKPLDECLRRVNGPLEAATQPRLRLLLLFAGLKHAPAAEAPAILARMGWVAAQAEGGNAGEVSTPDAWKQMKAVEELCNQVCQKTALPWRVKMPALNDTPSPGWTSVKAEGSSRGLIRCVYNWAVMTDDGKNESKATVSC